MEGVKEVDLFEGKGGLGVVPGRWVRFVGWIVLGPYQISLQHIPNRYASQAWTISHVTKSDRSLSKPPQPPSSCTGAQYVHFPSTSNAPIPLLRLTQPLFLPDVPSPFPIPVLGTSEIYNPPRRCST